MKILKQEGADSRIVQKWSFSALGWIICRQRKGVFGWRRTAWLYTNQCKTLDDYANHFNWEEKRIKIGSYCQYTDKS